MTSIPALCRPLARPCPGCGDDVVIFTDARTCLDCEIREWLATTPKAAPVAASVQAKPAAKVAPRSVPDAIRSLFDEEGGPVPARARVRGGRR